MAFNFRLLSEIAYVKRVTWRWSIEKIDTYKWNRWWIATTSCHCFNAMKDVLWSLCSLRSCFSNVISTTEKILDDFKDVLKTWRKERSQDVLKISFQKRFQFETYTIVLELVLFCIAYMHINIPSKNKKDVYNTWKLD